MSYEPEQESQEGQEGAENAEGVDGNADDLNAALGGGEMTFVTETKQPMNKGTLVVVGLLIACGAATYFMYVKSGPAEAVAAAGDPKAEQTIGQFLSGSEQNVSLMRKMLQDTEKVVTQFRTSANDTQIPLAKLGGNPFMKEKPRPKEDTVKLEREEQVRLATARATEAIAELRLQTIIHRDPKKASCMVNNTLYRKGQKISAAEGKVTFVIEEIRPDGVTVTTPALDQVLKFELKMKQ